MPTRKATAKQIAANRLNAQKSTGPRTPEGKARSSKNGFIHGFCSADPVIEALGETRAQVEALLIDYGNSLQPATPIEASLVREIAIADHRLQRCTRSDASLWTFRYYSLDTTRSGVRPTDRAEANIELAGAAVADTMPGRANTLLKFMRYETAIRNSWFRALNQFQKLRARPIAPPDNFPPPDYAVSFDTETPYQPIYPPMPRAQNAEFPPEPDSAELPPIEWPNGTPPVPDYLTLPPNFFQLPLVERAFALARAIPDPNAPKKDPAGDAEPIK